MAAAPADDRRVVGDRLHRLVRSPMRALQAASSRHQLNAAAEMDVVAHLRARELPGIAEREPLLRKFVLPTVADHLPEQPVIVADAIAVGRDTEGREALHETGGQSTEAAVAERCIRFGGPQAVEIDAEITERSAKLLDQSE